MWRSSHLRESVEDNERITRLLRSVSSQRQREFVTVFVREFVTVFVSVSERSVPVLVRQI